MATVVRMPSVLAGATEATIANWLVQPGDTVAAGTPMAEIETEKALVEYAAEEAGLIGRLVLAVGATGEIGDPIAVLISPNETDADIDAALGSPPANATPASPPANAGPASPPALGPSIDTSASTTHTPPADLATKATHVTEPAAAAPARAAVATTNGHHDVTAGASTRIFASPLVRKVAGEKGVDLAVLAGTGPNGRIVRRDLEQFLAARPAQAPASPAAAALAAPAAPTEATSLSAASTAPTAPTAPAPVTGTRLIPHTAMRRAIACRLTRVQVDRAALLPDRRVRGR